MISTRDLSKLPDIDSLIYEQKPLTVKFVREINPNARLRRLNADIAEIGYPKLRKK